MKRILTVLLLLGIGLGIGGCLDIPEEVEVKVSELPPLQIEFLAEEALKRLEPFAVVGAGIDPLKADDEEVYCNVVGDCVTAGEFREAASFMLENVVVP